MKPAAADYIMTSSFPGEKLLYPSLYGPDEYLVVGLAIFVIFVIIKHIIFHTIYFWWYRHGQFYIPNKFWSVVTGKSLTQRLTNYIRIKTKGYDVSIDDLMSVIDDYCKNKEFAPSLGPEKGKVVDDIVVEYQPREVLVFGCHVGYILLQILRSSPKDVRIFALETKPEYIAFAKFLLKLVNKEDKVIFLCAGLNQKTLDDLRNDYGVLNFDFVFFNRTEHDIPSYVPLVKLLESDAGKGGYFHHGKEKNGELKSVVLADKVVVLGDPEFLKYVRNSDKYQTQYYQMALEHSSDEIVDGMEKAVYIGR